MLDIEQIIKRLQTEFEEGEVGLSWYGHERTPTLLVDIDHQQHMIWLDLDAATLDDITEGIIDLLMTGADE